MDVGSNSTESPFEDFLCNKADVEQTPILGTFELNPTCNMDCEMCYIRMSQEEVKHSGGLRPAKFWVDLAREAMSEGMLFLLLTGGEPLIYPHFKELFVQLQEMGLFLTMNTNGTLIDRDMARFLGEHMPRRLNITLYGKDDETYGRLCHNPRGFTQLSNAMKYLKEFNVPVRLNCSVTRENVDELPELQRIANEWGAPLEFAYYMFPPHRKTCINNFEQYRLSPEEAARAAVWIEYRFCRTEEDRRQAALSRLGKICQDPEKRPVKPGFICRGGNSSFWVNWKGQLGACGIMTELAQDLGEQSFAAAWEKLKADVKAITLSEKCYHCAYLDICPHCAAGEVAEGDFGIAPDYQCRLTREYVRLLKEACHEPVL